MKLTEHDSIVTAYAETACGPGWANAPIWVIVRSRLDGSYRMECIQPMEQSAEMMLLYRVSMAAHVAMTDAVRTHLAAKKGARMKRAKPDDPDQHIETPA